MDKKARFGMLHLTNASAEPGGLTVVMYDGSKIPWETISAATSDKIHSDNAEEKRKSTRIPHKTRLDKGPSSDVRLFKQWISSNVDAGGPGDIFASCTVLRRLAHDMAEIAGAHCNYRFLLRSRTEAGMPVNFLLLSLLGQRSTILSNCLGSIKDPAFSEPQDSAMEETIPRDEECSHILEALQQSTLLMPPTQRILNGLPVGFLPV
ncbi:hypothetical protein GUITHDRAFT_100837 [Guillardia theta CCMP2712]|uniref:Uncharacterized protein n=1 Tax=Guillardia theta (strain CCMP2712) TaxID=905079 RepID=L1JZ79_GUITC|nr:hypothetical protein GUITHDRAFT_100837 [Guillardia theta CCMP2712]EKX53871.1 hypothetical protein GUITHDRAFT_100837 [Guillardia theta CCMP2712]|eukprot:XP_005840851.1 hypothetical protein GUITHDRAFT_100837 [Guillardia theta CCMP2712]